MRICLFQRSKGTVQLQAELLCTPFYRCVHVTSTNNSQCFALCWKGKQSNPPQVSILIPDDVWVACPAGGLAGTRARVWASIPEALMRTTARTNTGRPLPSPVCQRPAAINRGEIKKRPEGGGQSHHCKNASVGIQNVT